MDRQEACLQVNNLNYDMLYHIHDFFNIVCVFFPVFSVRWKNHKESLPDTDSSLLVYFQIQY